MPGLYLRVFGVAAAAAERLIVLACPTEVRFAVLVAPPDLRLEGVVAAGRAVLGGMMMDVAVGYGNGRS